eukprot:TRINITY_DN1491_c0_g1_i1.p1 TRINITY_DN1491_c0_g1~~TRINITY_DN1491_c0_g1_i1.p1  ORF type:complete len:514 (-),score=145.00 TRINITY_DN1491_c0_g1_i1:132-1556(-)
MSVYAVLFLLHSSFYSYTHAGRRGEDSVQLSVSSEAPEAAPPPAVAKGGAAGPPAKKGAPAVAGKDDKDDEEIGPAMDSKGKSAVSGPSGKGKDDESDDESEMSERDGDDDDVPYGELDGEDGPEDGDHDDEDDEDGEVGDGKMIAQASVEKKISSQPAAGKGPARKADDDEKEDAQTKPRRSSVSFSDRDEQIAADSGLDDDKSEEKPLAGKAGMDDDDSEEEPLPGKAGMDDDDSDEEPSEADKVSAPTSSKPAVKAPKADKDVPGAEQPRTGKEKAPAAKVDEDDDDESEDGAAKMDVEDEPEDGDGDDAQEDEQQPRAGNVKAPDSPAAAAKVDELDESGDADEDEEAGTSSVPEASNEAPVAPIAAVPVSDGGKSPDEKTKKTAPLASEWKGCEKYLLKNDGANYYNADNVKEINEKLRTSPKFIVNTGKFDYELDFSGDQKWQKNLKYGTRRELRCVPEGCCTSPAAK